MSDHYKILWEGGQGELVEKKSRFIATTEPVETEEEALAFIERTRKKYWDARHNCFAYCTVTKTSFSGAVTMENQARQRDDLCWMCFWEQKSTTSAWWSPGILAVPC